MRKEIKTFAILFGRKGSMGFPGKNLYPILGRPAMVYPILAAKHSKYIDKIYVSTDDPEIAKISKEDFGAEIIERPPELCTPEVLIEDAMVHGYKYIEGMLKDEGKEIELIALLLCNAAAILSETIDKGVTILRENPDYDSAVTVSMYNMWSPLRARKIGYDGLIHPVVPFEIFGDTKRLSCDRDSQGDMWFPDGGVSIVKPHCLEKLSEGLLPYKWLGQRIYPLKQWGGCDVDYEWQIPTVEYWLKKHGFTNDTTPYEK